MPISNKRMKMRDLRLTTNYKKQLKTASTYKGYDKELLNKYLDMLRRGEKLPSDTDDHPMAKHSTGRYKNTRNFHLAPDLVVVYRLTDDAVELIAIGQHNKLYLTSSYKYFA